MKPTKFLLVLFTLLIIWLYLFLHFNRYQCFATLDSIVKVDRLTGRISYYSSRKWIDITEATIVIRKPASKLWEKAKRLDSISDESKHYTPQKGLIDFSDLISPQKDEYGDKDE